MAGKQGTPLWITLGCGCLLLVGLVIGAVVAAGFFGVSAFKGYVDDMKDPAVRAAKAGEILGTSSLPDGYSAQLFLRIPWVFDMVVLTDGEPMPVEEGDDFDLTPGTVGEHLFLYFKLRRKKLDEEEIERMLRGEPTSDGIRADVGLEFEPEEELARGAFEIEPQRLAYVAHRGELDFEERDLPGIFSQVVIDCPGDDLTRVAVWFRRDPEDLAPGEVSDPAGSPADEAALRAMMAHFNVCVD